MSAHRLWGDWSGSEKVDGAFGKQHKCAFGPSWAQGCTTGCGLMLYYRMWRLDAVLQDVA